MFRYFTLLLALLTFAGSSTLRAEEPSADNREAALRKIAEGLKYKQGEVTLKGGLAKINVPNEFRYLDGPDASKVLTQIWGNPPDETLGMLVPADFDPLGSNTWAVEITYSEEGYVKDDDAAKINYDDELKNMKKNVAEESKQRMKEGYPSIELIGWATPPKYDAVEKKIYWAKEIKFGGRPKNTLNYCIRILGRRGVLQLNAIGSMEALPAIEKVTPSILATVNFQEGHRYADFNSSTDKVAAYGLAGLVAGGVLAKAGFFKVLLAGILAAKKFVVIGVIALFAAIKKLFGGKSQSA